MRIATTRGRSRALRLLAAVATAAATLLGAGGPAAAQLMDTPWPMFQHDPKHTGRSTLPGPAVGPVSIKWKYKALNWPKPQVTIGPDARIYLGAGRQPICAIDEETGEEIWCTVGGSDANTSSPAIGVSPDPAVDYVVYMGARDNKLTAYLPNGDIDWAYQIPKDGDVHSSTVIALDGTLYTACGCLSAGIVHAFNPNPPTPDGLLKWKLQLGAGIRNSSPALSDSGRIYIGTTNGRLWAIDDRGTSGHVAWSLPLGTKNFNSSPSIGADGAIYMGTNLGIHKVIDHGTFGTVEWTTTTDGEVDTTPALGNGGMVVASSYKTGFRTLYALAAADGASLFSNWPIKLPAPATTSYSQSPSPVIDLAGNIYAGFGKQIRAYRPTGTQRWQFTLPGSTSNAIALTLGDGMLYVGSRDKYLYAIQPAGP